MQEVPPAPDSPASLLDKLRSALVVRHYSLRTMEAYLAWVRRFIMFHGRQHRRVSRRRTCCSF
jgi:hypothetical protein